MPRIGADSLLIFVKAPIPGLVKTRLQPELTPEQAALFYRAMVEDILFAHSGQRSYDVTIYYSPEEACRNIVDWLGSGWSYRCQQGASLGDRMYNAFVDSFKAGYEKMVIIGTDCPQLGAEHIEEAFILLEDSDLVIGPSDDGGYHLIGVTRPWEPLFSDITWGTDRVFNQTMAKAVSAGYRCKALPMRYDIDTFAGIERLYQALQKEEAISPFKSTKRALEQILWKRASAGKDHRRCSRNLARMVSGHMSEKVRSS